MLFVLFIVRGVVFSFRCFSCILISHNMHFCITFVLFQKCTTEHWCNCACEKWILIFTWIALQLRLSVLLRLATMSGHRNENKNDEDEWIWIHKRWWFRMQSTCIFDLLLDLSDLFTRCQNLKHLMSLETKVVNSHCWKWGDMIRNYFLTFGLVGFFR